MKCKFTACGQEAATKGFCRRCYCRLWARKKYGHKPKAEKKPPQEKPPDPENVEKMLDDMEWERSNARKRGGWLSS